MWCNCYIEGFKSAFVRFVKGDKAYLCNPDELYESEQENYVRGKTSDYTRIVPLVEKDQEKTHVEFLSGVIERHVDSLEAAKQLLSFQLLKLLHGPEDRFRVTFKEGGVGVYPLKAVEAWIDSYQKQGLIEKLEPLTELD